MAGPHDIPNPSTIVQVLDDDTLATTFDKWAQTEAAAIHNLDTNDTSPSIPASTNEPPAQKPTEKTPSAENHEGAPQDAILYTHRKKMNYQPSCDCAADEPYFTKSSALAFHFLKIKNQLLWWNRNAALLQPWMCILQCKEYILWWLEVEEIIIWQDHRELWGPFLNTPYPALEGCSPPWSATAWKASQTWSKYGPDDTRNQSEWNMCV